MTELDVSKWRDYAPIDWQRLARAYTFFKEKGYEYVEVPWAVSDDVVAATIPPSAIPVSVHNSDAILIGSAEQGFLDIATRDGDRFVPGGLYFSISPCFRGESILHPGHTQLTFMKLELFTPEVCEVPQRVFPSKEGVGLFLLDDAEQFMTSEGAHLVRVKTSMGSDLECGGIEVGSYGTRTHPKITWAYATGLAEPRFSTALRKQRHDRKRFFR